MRISDNICRLATALGLCALSATACAQVTYFAQSSVAGTPNDLMIVRHFVIRGDNFAIGTKLAQIAREQHHSELLPIQDANTARLQTNWLRTHYPERYVRAAGVRGAYGLSKDTKLDVTFLPIDMVFKPACSVVYYPGSSVSTGHAMLSRNYDFTKGTYAQITNRPSPPGARSMTGDPYVIEMYPDHGYSSLYLCAYDLEGAAIDEFRARFRLFFKRLASKARFVQFVKYSVSILLSQ